MHFILNFPLFSVILALLCAVISSALPGKAARRLSLAMVGFVGVLQLFLLIHMIKHGGTVTYMMGHFPAPWGNELKFGALEPLFSAIFCLVLILSIVGGKLSLNTDIAPSKINFYFVMINLIQAALLVLVYTNDLFTGYVFIEICTIASCSLLMIREVGRTTLAAVRYMIFSLLGSGLFLLGVILLYNVTGHLLMPNLRDAVAVLWQTGSYHTPLLVIISLMTVGLGIKSGLFPFHFWMPDTYGYATPTSSAILSGIISKGYIFLLIKIIFSVIGVNVYYACGAQRILFVFGCLGIVIGSISAIHENNINRMIAYSSAAQIGYVFMGIGLSPYMGVVAAMFQMLGHAFTKPMLFLSAARLAAVSNKSKKFADLQGAAHRDRVAGIAFTIGSLSMIGLPAFIGFTSKYLFARAAFATSMSKLFPVLIVLAISTILNTIYYFRTVLRIYTPSEGGAKTQMRWTEEKPFSITAICFIIINLCIGLHFQPLADLLELGLKLLS